VRPISGCPNKKCTATNPPIRSLTNAEHAVVDADAGPIEAFGKVQMGWHPYPAPRAVLEFAPPDARPALELVETGELRLKIGPTDAIGLVSHYTISGTTVRTRLTIRDLEHGSGAGLSHVVFHVINGGRYVGSPIREQAANNI
jgi:hypothetical protein